MIVEFYVAKSVEKVFSYNSNFSSFLKLVI